MNESGIEWIQNPNGSKGLTCNPIVGCEEVSPGCRNCWAKELVATRMIRNPKLPMYSDLARVTDGGKSQWSGIVKLVPERLKDVVALGKARKRVNGKLVSFSSRVFVCDMSDLFHDAVPFEYIAAVFGAMACAPNHLFYVLTKRPARAVEFAKWIKEQGAELVEEVGEEVPSTTSPEGSACIMHYNDQFPVKEWLPASAYNQAPWPLPNVAFGVTVEDRRYGVPRLELARQFPARYHWVSVEPLLEDLGDVDFTGFDLAVVGAESGEGYRPFDPQWARNVKAVCDRSGTRFFWKQGPGGDTALAHAPEDLRIRENLPMP